MGNTIKRFLALLLAVVMVVGMVPANNVFAEDTVPVLPTATVTQIEKEDLTFALNFKADEVSEEQLDYFGEWFADFELTVNKDVTFNANGGADGYLSGKYGEYGWISVPFDNVTLKAGQTLKIMEFAAEMLNEPGLKYTYAEVYETVRDFDCGVFFTPEFLAANPDLEVTLGLRMYDPAKPDEGHTVGETYTFMNLPTATVTQIEKEDLTFALNFKADEVSAEQLDYFGKWFADFELTVNKDVTFNANGGADGYLSGKYGDYGWISVPFDNVTLKAGQTLKIMEFAAEMLNEPGLKYTYAEVYETVRDFDCGVFFTPEFLAANPDLEVTLGLRMYDPAKPAEGHTIGETYEFENTFTDYVAYNTATNKMYTKVSEGVLAATAGQTVKLLRNAEDHVINVLDGVTLDLNGYTLNTSYMFCVGMLVDNSESNAGLLNAGRIMIREDNIQLPVKTADGGYKFFEILGFNKKVKDPDAAGSEKYIFQPLFEAAAHEYILAGKDVSGVSVVVRVSWQKDEDLRSQDFVYGDLTVNDVVSSYKAETGKYGRQFALTLRNVANYANLKYQIRLVSDTGAAMVAEADNTKTNAGDSDSGMTDEETRLSNEAGTALVPAGTKLDGSQALSLNVSPMESGENDVTVNENEEKTVVDIHVAGVAADNTVPILITLTEFMAPGLNKGNLALYHVEKGVTNLMTQVDTVAAVDAHNEFYYNPETGDVTMALATFSEIAMVSDTTSAWKGNFDYSWYKPDAEVYEIFNADQLASFGAIVDGTAEGYAQNSFEGKAIKLCNDINLGGEEGGKSFNPIGYGYESSGGQVFKGIFDGNGCTISNLYQNGWDLGLSYSTAGGGLFASAVDATFKNLTLDNAYVVMECIDMGALVGYAYGKCHFENIFVTNSTVANYNRYTGGVVGEVGGGSADLKGPASDNPGDTANYSHVFINVNVDSGTVISALWGTFDPGVGGIIGGKYGTATVYMKGCNVACELDVYNDVTSAYQWYSYRRCGMLIGDSEESKKEESGRTVATASYLTTEDCTVGYGDWVNYKYCEFGAERYPFVRVQKGEFNGAYSNARYGNPTGKSGNKVSADHEFNVEHNEGEAHELAIVFNQLYGGGQGCYGGNGHIGNGVGIATAPTTVRKFVGNAETPNINDGTSVTLGELFAATGDGDIQNFYVHAFVSNIAEGYNVSAKFERNESDWTQSKLTFSGEGMARITISDYYFCYPTTIHVNVGSRESVQKFEVAFDHDAATPGKQNHVDDYLYRVGNENPVTLGTLFSKIDGIENIGNVRVDVETINGATGEPTSNATWTNGTIKFSGTGVVKVIIYDDDYCTPTELLLEVVDATNVTGLSGTISGNVVLLNDCGLSSLTVSGRNAVYGNGFTATYTGNGQYLNNGLKQGIVTVSENGTLDNLRIKATIYPKAYLYYGSTLLGDYVQGGPSSVEGDKTRYHYQLSAVAASGNATISNCYIYGGRTNIFVNTGDVTITDTVLECGTVANVQIQSNASHTVTFEDVTTIQYRVNATIGDTSKVMLGAGILVGPETNDNPTIVLNGDFEQYNWVTEDDANAVSDTKVTKAIIQGALGATAYNHTINGKTASNLGIIYMNEFEVKVENNTGLPYILDKITITPEGFGGNSAKGQVCSLQGASAEQIHSDYANADKTTFNGYYEPQFKYSADLGGQYVAEGGDEHCYREGDTIHVMFHSGETRELDLAALVEIAKYSGQNLNTKISVKDADGNVVTVTNGKITLSELKEYTITYSATDTVFYDKDGKIVTETRQYSWDVALSVSLKDAAVPNARFVFDSTKQIMGYGKKSGLSAIGKSNFQYLPFLAGLRIYDYNGKTEYLRFDGDNDFAKIAKVELTCESNNSYVTVTLTDGGVVHIAFTGRAASGGDVHTGTIKTSGKTVYYLTDDDTSATTTTWQIHSYSFIGNNGVEIKDTTQVFRNCENGTLPSGNFSTTINYTVTYDANEGNCGQTMGYATSASAAVTLPTPTRSGYIFSGWYTAASGGTRVGGAGESYTPTANITLFAQWGKPCTVTYNANGGSVTPASEKYTSTALTLPTPTRDGYWFIGWYDAAEGGNKIGDAGAAYNPTGEITLYAHWQEKVEYTVTYNANGGTCGTASATYQGTALTLPTPTRTGYTFNGWYTAASGGTKVGDAGASYTPSANITLYAQWEKIAYKITVTTSNATVSGVTNGQTAYYGDTITFTVAYSKSSNKTTTVKDSNGNNVTTTGSYTFTMPASDVTIDASSSDACFTSDTLITLADGTQKRVDELTWDDKILAWDFFTGTYVEKRISILVNHGEDIYRVANLEFSDGTVLRLIADHGVFDYDLNKFVYITVDNMADYVGHRFVQYNADGSYNIVTLDEAFETEEITSAYSISSSVTSNAFASGMLTVAPPEDFYNWIEMDGKLHYDVQKFRADVEQYGLYSYDVFADYVTYQQYVDWNGAYLKIPVEKGLFTFEYILELIERYASYMPE